MLKPNSWSGYFETFNVIFNFVMFHFWAAVHLLLTKYGIYDSFVMIMSMKLKFYQNARPKNLFAFIKLRVHQSKAYFALMILSQQHSSFV